MTIKFKHTGHFKNTDSFFSKLLRRNPSFILRAYGLQGLRALASATPKDSGKTSESWSYDVRKTKSGWSLNFYNSNVNNGVPIAILIQYGHATGTGGYVQGRDFINPVIRPLFDKIAEKAWREVVGNDNY